MNVPLLVVRLNMGNHIMLRCEPVVAKRYIEDWKAGKFKGMTVAGTSPGIENPNERVEWAFRGDDVSLMHTQMVVVSAAPPGAPTPPAGGVPWQQNPLLVSGTRPA